ncbi:MAG: helix-turn-helix domain-containing protein [Planctomycetia bacterium]
MNESVDTVDVIELLDERAAARRLGISPRSMWGLADSGAIPFIRIGPRLKRYDPRDLADFIERSRRRAAYRSQHGAGSSVPHLLCSATADGKPGVSNPFTRDARGGT